MPQSQFRVAIPPWRLEGDLSVPPQPKGVIVFAHGSGSSRFSPRNRAVAAALVEAGFATLLLDLLTEEEASRRANVFDIDLLGERLLAAIDWVAGEPELASLPIGLFGASTGAAAALKAAAARPGRVAAVVSRGGRPDLAGEALQRVEAPTLLVVGGRDEAVLRLNHEAMQRIGGLCRLEVAPGATHLFEEPGALDLVTRLAADWFARQMAPADVGA